MNNLSSLKHQVTCPFFDGLQISV